MKTILKYLDNEGIEYTLDNNPSPEKIEMIKKSMKRQEKIDLEYKNIGAVNLYPRDDDGYAVIEEWGSSKSEFNIELVNIRTESCTDIYPNDSEREVLIPKALEGIYDNNGWNSIEEMGLPESEESVIWLRDTGEPAIIASMLDEGFYGVDYFTHWRTFNFKQPVY